ncbi:MAG: RHS repeat-associated core domain-containing protein [Saprospiraceae bacterium]|nr:RHS repeat-associated core domain-containing protein [Saprospiraceae bacterium]
MLEYAADYYPFGSILREWSNCEKSRFLFTYKERDAETGWDNLGARLYDSDIGRFLGVDPIADQFPHVNSYNYAENEPVANIDLWGLQKMEAHTTRSSRLLNNYISLMYKDRELYREGVSKCMSCVNPKHIIYIVQSNDFSWTSASGQSFLKGEAEKYALSLLHYRKNAKELDDYGAFELDRLEKMFKELGLTPQVVLKLKELGYRQDVVVAGDEYDLAHEIILHVNDVAEDGKNDKTVHEEHEEGFGTDWYQRTITSTALSPSMEETPINSKMGRIYQKMKKQKK